MKKTFKRLLSAILSMIMVLSVIPMAGISSFAVTSGDFEYEILSETDKTCEITNYTGSATNLTIPSEINGYKVTGIGDYAFVYCTSLTSVTIPDSVTSIGYAAFCDCASLASITISDGVTSICQNAFENTAYYNNESNWKNDVLYIGKYLIKAKETLNGDYSVKSGTKVISKGAFSGCDLTSIALPESVTDIGSDAFANCTSLTSVTIPESIAIIEYDTFAACTSLTNITIPESVTYIDSYAFWGCTSLTNITITDNVTNIGDEAFGNTAYYNNESNWENDVLYIGKYLIKAKETLSGDYSIKSDTKVIADYAFSYLPSLTSVIIDNSVTNIGDGAFYYCETLTSITIGNGVTSIGDYSFDCCSSLTNISVKENNNNYSSLDGVLFNKDKTELIQYPAGNARTSYAIPNSVAAINDYAFSSCTSLTNIDLPESVTNIGDGAFVNCTSLTNITIPNSVTIISESSFSNCTALTNVNIPEGVTEICACAFEDCTSLKSVVIPKSVSTIGYQALGYIYDTSYYAMQGARDAGPDFIKMDGFTIYGYKGTAAETYANENEFKFVALDADVSMYRLYNENSGEHFYTADVNEKNHLVSVGWTYEGIGWTAPETSSTPVYRLYNKEGGEHHYTTDMNEKNNLVSIGWTDEGIGWYSDDAQGVPLYRQYNPNAFANNHNYTTNKAENDWLVSLGWRYEGIGWYGVA